MSIERWGPAEALRLRSRVVAFAPESLGLRAPPAPPPDRVDPPRVGCGAGGTQIAPPASCCAGGAMIAPRRVRERGGLCRPHPDPPALLLLLRILVQSADTGTRR